MVRLEVSSKSDSAFVLAYFNSKMVRLEGAAVMPPAMVAKQFQFQDGAVRRKTLFMGC